MTQPKPQGSSMTEHGARDGLPKVDTLRLSIDEMNRLFNSMDPAPFRERDLDPNAEEFIVSWAREMARTAPLRMTVRLLRQPVSDSEARILAEAVQAYFLDRARSTRTRLRQLFRVGRVSLLIGLAFLAFAIFFGEFAASFATSESSGTIVKESFIIGGWVALWRPLEIFLYDWWPIRDEARLFDRLGVMDIAVEQDGPAGVAA